MDYQTLFIVFISGIIGYLFLRYSKSITLYHVVLIIMSIINSYVVFQIILNSGLLINIIPILGFSFITIVVFEISRAYFDNSLHLGLSGYSDFKEYGLEYYLVIVLFYSALLFVFLLYIVPLGKLSILYLSAIISITSLLLFGRSIVRYWAFELYLLVYIVLTVWLILLEFIEINHYPVIILPYVFILLYYFSMRSLIKEKADKRTLFKRRL
ncbi:conserved hypothetical protein [Methanococcus vannielii SB]|uniref:Uncharacterized protein n=1 Tax=Methanococcus vannielii (strain ATCC 35089 / DSM 1224 / JCM 13029 / OCM 148 / SB) TaxID=406327 RepID=A6UQW4_METVS|nr:hypothetical protein [Methanococcus vannielii]ABR54886.1 conserved hypothetical protein [Methanococcus vannielii SB]